MNVYIYIPIITIPIQCSDTCHDMPSSIYEATLIPSVAAVAYGGSDAVGMWTGPVSPSAGVQMLNLMAKHNLRYPPIQNNVYLNWCIPRFVQYANGSTKKTIQLG